MERTRNETLVFDFLDKLGKPASAYDILDALRDEGLRAPLQVYRALSKLVEQGSVHRIESLNAFVACRHSHCDATRISIFMLCNICDEVSETSDDAAATAIQQLCQTRNFSSSRQVIEISGTCTACNRSTH